jgi:hypothetical protein
MNKTILAVIAFTVSAGLAAAGCSTATNTADTTSTAVGANKTAVNANTAVVTNSEAGHSNNGTDEIPTTVKKAFPDAQSFTKQHKDVPQGAIAEIEKETGGKVPDTDHHSYLAFSSAGGSRRQIGAATVVKAGGKEMVIVYDNKDGSPVIKEVRADGVPGAFLTQFAGKGHDDKFQIGSDLKASGVDEATAKTIAQTVRIDVLTMQTLFGAAHTH